jgi:hypothetical protein
MPPVTVETIKATVVTGVMTSRIGILAFRNMAVTFGGSSF